MQEERCPTRIRKFPQIFRCITPLDTEGNARSESICAFSDHPVERLWRIWERLSPEVQVAVRAFVEAIIASASPEGCAEDPESHQKRAHASEAEIKRWYDV